MISQLVFRSFMLGLTAALAGAGIVGASAADGPKPITSKISGVRDARLSEDGVLSLQLLTKDGQGIADIEVLVSYEDQQIASGETKADGSVEFTGLRPGVHQLSAGAGRETLRIWTYDTAPPKAVNRVAIVTDERVVRGQIGIFTPDPNSPPNSNGYTFGGQMIDPLLLGAVAVGTVAVVKVNDLEDEVDALRRASP
jgi:hypothetical protein